MNREIPERFRTKGEKYEEEEEINEIKTGTVTSAAFTLANGLFFFSLFLFFSFSFFFFFFFFFLFFLFHFFLFLFCFSLFYFFFLNEKKTATIGAGILGLPFVMATSGLILGIVLLLFFGLMANVTLRFLHLDALLSGFSFLFSLFLSLSFSFFLFPSLSFSLLLSVFQFQSRIEKQLLRDWGKQAVGYLGFVGVLVCSSGFICISF